jgi:hypothetical protein
VCSVFTQLDWFFTEEMKYHRILSTTIVSFTATATIRRIVIATSIGANSNNITSAFVDISHLGRISPAPSSLYNSGSSRSMSESTTMIDPIYPGTAVERLQNVHRRVAELVQTVPPVLDGPWEMVRQKILWAGGLRDLPNAIPGQVRFHLSNTPFNRCTLTLLLTVLFQGYTGHSFNDFNHVDLTCMRDSLADNENDGSVKGIAIGNHLGDGIRIASIPDLGPGGSWSTCALGCSKEPPQDVAHVQFRARIAFKLVWVPNERYDTFVLVDDDGKLLAKGTPSGELPSLREREMNYKIVAGSKYSKAADLIAKNVAAE